MKTYLTYKDRIQGFKDVSETVKTVEKIAASSVHFLKQEVSSLNIYTTEIEKVLARLSMFYQKNNNPLLQKKTIGKKVIVILTGNKGLVGKLWHGVISVVLENIEQYQSVIVVGIKGKKYLEEENIPITKSFTNMSDILQKEEREYIANYMFNKFKKGTFSQVDILYPRFVSLAEQQFDLIPFLPFEFKLTKEKKSEEGLPIFEPSKRKVFNQLLQKYIEVFFYKVVTETKLSEFSARTVAMEHASAKTDEFIQKFTLDFLKERRRVATQKQLESFVTHKIV